MAWVTTKTGKHINTDWFDEDAAKKESQIAANKAEADQRNQESKNNLRRIGQIPSQLGESPAQDAKQVVQKISEYTGFSAREAEEIQLALCGYNKKTKDYDPSYFSGADGQIRAAETPVMKQKAEAIQKYIDAAPKYKGTIYRPLQVDDSTLAALTVGTEFNEQAYAVSSWSSDQKVSERYASGTVGGQRIDSTKKAVIFQCTNHNHGTPVQHLSTYPLEKEVLVNNSGVSYRITDRTQYRGNTKMVTVITLEEV